MPRISGRGVIGIALAHAALLGLLAMLDVTPIRASMATLTVDLIPAAVQPVAAEKPPTPATAKPAPVTPRQPPRVQAPMLAAQTEAPTATVDSSKPSEPAAPAAAPSSAKAAAVSPPRFDADYLHNPAPVYPALSRRMGEEGRVMLRVFVDATGRPAQIELNSSSGSARLDAAAQEAVWRWSFVAARRGDDSVGAWVLVPIVFNLRG